MKKLFDYIITKVDEAELYLKSESIISINIKQDKVQAVDGKNVLGIALRMNKDGKTGSAVSTSLDDLSIVERAIISSQYQGDKTTTFKYEKADDIPCFNQDLHNMSEQKMIDEGFRVLNKIKTMDSSIVCTLSLEKKTEKVAIMNTEGLNDSYDKTLYSISVTTMSDDGFRLVNISDSKTSFFEISDEDLESLVMKHNISKTSVKIKTGKMPVVFSGNAMGGLLTRLLAGVNGEFIAKGVSPLHDKIDSKIASEALSIYDDATYADGCNAYKFDDEGTPGQKTTIIEKGILKNFLVSRSVEEKLNRKATGNARKKTLFTKDIENLPAVDSSNFLVESGIDDQSILDSVDYGIYVESLMGIHTGNIPAGEYSLNVGSGYLIEKGKLSAKIVDVMVAGNIYEDFLKIESVGSKKEKMQIIFYPMGYSPMVKFNDISVVGSK